MAQLASSSKFCGHESPIWADCEDMARITVNLLKSLKMRESKLCKGLFMTGKFETTLE